MDNDGDLYPSFKFFPENRTFEIAPHGNSEEGDNEVKVMARPTGYSSW
jgi:hypothetical protein